MIITPELLIIALAFRNRGDPCVAFCLCYAVVRSRTIILPQSFSPDFPVTHARYANLLV